MAYYSNNASTNKTAKAGTRNLAASNLPVYRKIARFLTGSPLPEPVTEFNSRLPLPPEYRGRYSAWSQTCSFITDSAQVRGHPAAAMPPPHRSTAVGQQFFQSHRIDSWRIVMACEDAEAVPGDF